MSTFLLLDSGPVKEVEKRSGNPSVFGPGFATVPGGPDYLNRTVYSWHYYCWATAQIPNGNEPYDPLTR